MGECSERGVVLAEFHKSDVYFSLETNGEEGDMYLEIVEFEVGTSMEGEFSHPIYDVPKTIEDVEEMFSGFLNENIK